MTVETYLQRVREILHPESGIKSGPEQKSMIAEAYDIHISGLQREHAESRTEGLLQFIRDQEEREQEEGAV